MRYVVFACLMLGALARGATADPLDKPWFTATPAELLAAAKGATAGDHDAVILREDVVISYDAAGRGEERTRLVFAIVAPSAVDGWGTLSLSWAPFYQDKPAIRARVIAPDGTVAEFDPSLIHDAPAVNESPTVFLIAAT
jgi:hypothetical protein